MTKDSSSEELYNSRIIKIYLDYIEKNYPNVDFDILLDRAGIHRYAVEDPGHWFNQEDVDLFHKSLVEITQNPNIAREAGRYVVSSEASGVAKQYTLGLLSLASVYLLMEKLYPIMSRAATIKVKKLGSSQVEIIATPKQGVQEKPYQCQNRIGTFESMAKLFTGRFAEVQHPSCFHTNHQACRYIVTWEKVPYVIWRRARNGLALASLLACITLAFSLPIIPWLTVCLACALGVTLLSLHSGKLQKRELSRTIETQGNAAKNLLDEMNMRYNDALLVQEIGQATSTILEIENAVNVILKVMEKRLDYDRGMIMLGNKEKTKLIFTSGYGYQKEQEDALRKMEFHLDKPHSKGAFVFAYREQKPYLLTNAKKIEDSFSKRSLKLMREMGVQSLVCVPIIYENESLGILAADNIKSKRPLTQSDVNLLLGVAAQTAASISNAKSFQEKKQLEAQLQAAQKMEAIGTLAGGIAHDFNNILQTIFGYTQIMLMGKRSQDPDYNNLVAMENAAQRASDLTKRLLIFGRKVESNLRPLDLNQEVEQVYNMLERTLPKMIEVDLNLAPKIRVVNADPVQIEQVMLNLGVNARDAMPEGGKLTFKTENVALSEEFCRTNLGASPGEYALLTISDSGQGMDSDILEHIYEPFFTTKEAGKGTGLGLAMVYGIVKNHSGYITCDSRPGDGTTFRVYLPEIGEALEEPEKKEKDFPLEGGSGTILFVDDEETIRQIGKEMLARFGFSVITAEDGEKALELYRNRQDEIDLVIIDLIMPGMGGNKCIKELFRIDPKVKVVITSGYAIDGSTQEAIELGGKGFLAKPYNAPEMLHIVREAIRKDK